MPTNHMNNPVQDITPVAQVADLQPEPVQQPEPEPIQQPEPEPVQQPEPEPVQEKKTIDYNEFERIYEDLQKDIEAKKNVTVKAEEVTEENSKNFVSAEKYQKVLDNAQEMANYIEELERANREQKILIQDLTYEKDLISERAKKYQEKATIVDEEQYERLIPENLKELVDAARLLDKVNDQYSQRVYRQQVKLLTERAFQRPLDDYIQDVDAGVPEISASESLASYTIPTANVSPVASRQLEKARLQQMADLF